MGSESHGNVLLAYIFVSSHVPDLLDLTGYCVSASMSLLVGGFTYCFNIRTPTFWFFLSCYVRLFSAFSSLMEPDK